MTRKLTFYIRKKSKFRVRVPTLPGVIPLAQIRLLIKKRLKTNLRMTTLTQQNYRRLALVLTQNEVHWIMRVTTLKTKAPPTFDPTSTEAATIRKNTLVNRLRPSAIATPRIRLLVRTTELHIRHKPNGTTVKNARTTKIWQPPLPTREKVSKLATLTIETLVSPLIEGGARGSCKPRSVVMK